MCIFFISQNIDNFPNLEGPCALFQKEMWQTCNFKFISCKQFGSLNKLYDQKIEFLKSLSKLWRPKTPFGEYTCIPLIYIF